MKDNHTYIVRPCKFMRVIVWLNSAVKSIKLNERISSAHGQLS